MGALATGGDLLLPTRGAVGFLTRAAVFAAIPLVLYVTGFAHPQELQQARALLERLRRAPAVAGRGRRVSRPSVSVVMPFAGDLVAARAAVALVARARHRCRATN